MWLGASVEDDPRVFGDREFAEVFPTQAQAVIVQMPLAFDRAGFVFSVETAE
jgi:hypothetical protein